MRACSGLVSLSLLAVLWAASLSGCDNFAYEVRPGDDSALKDFGERCESNEVCRSTYCLAHPDGAFCSRLCELGCPAGWECKEVPNPHGFGGTVGLCAVIQNRLCMACVDDRSCNVTGSDLCSDIGGGNFCSTDCTYSSCPTGYTCSATDALGGALMQCLPDSAGCRCDATSVGMARGCEQSNDWGTCGGAEVCQGDQSWSLCDASTPVEELCDGTDNDCDGFIDEELAQAECVTSNEFGTCAGLEQCLGFDGWICDAEVPAGETCNYRDDDCDSVIDDDFVDEQGRYVANEHCGGCGQDCAAIIPHSVATECSIIDGEPQCRVNECEPGFFVYGDGLTCLGLPANLCLPCVKDEDCLVPDSRCVLQGTESYCARSCAPDSSYGASCPQGFICADYQGEAQCQPSNGSCFCTDKSVGTVRSCLVETCTGFQVCEAQPTQFAWTECNVEDYNVEICDGLDNNCDQQIDEGFLNQSTGRYDSPQHCGFCHNDCADYWSPEIHHVMGVCDSASASPSCKMGACIVETLGGESWEWVNVNTDSSDGCECSRRLGNVGFDPPDLMDAPEPGLTYVDENCDGVDGVIVDSLFVSAGATNGRGTIDAPYGTIGAAINAVGTSGKSIILVARGTYDEDVVLIAGIELHGGYSSDFKSRDVVLNATTLEGSSAAATLTATSITRTTVVSGFVIKGRDHEAAAANADGTASIAVWLTDCESNLVLRSNRIEAGRGGDGGRGASGQTGHGQQTDSALNGGTGLNGVTKSGPCVNPRNAGGAAGTNSACATANATPGGSSVCPVFDWNTTKGQRAEYPVGSGRNGAGGEDWTYDSMSGWECGHATESGFPVNIVSNSGDDGQSGADGANGAGGGGAAPRYGSIVNGIWVPAPAQAGAGARGVDGESGGGGGSGGGVAYFPSGGCGYFELAPSGGGGGAGGCGGEGGRAGRHGGASIAVLLSDSNPNDSRAPTLLFNVLQRGQGGTGGQGGFAGIGGLGGLGGFGGGPSNWITVNGGKGGDGGNGGPGGGGGGGSGGPSFDLLGYNVALTSFTSNNVFIYGQSVSTGGVGGLGGGSVGPNAQGGAGVAGAYGNSVELKACSAGCAANQTCDANGVCVPN